MGKNFVSYGDAETLMAEVADKIKGVAESIPTPADLSAYETSWTGTRAEWNALSDDEQAKYSIVNFIDDQTGGEMVVADEVTAGNMNPVTSNAVAEMVSVTEDLTSTMTLVDEQCDECAVKHRGNQLLVRISFRDNISAVGATTFAAMPFPDGYSNLEYEGSGVIFGNNGEVQNSFYANRYNSQLEFRFRATKTMQSGYLYVILWLK